jgi:hypothetical protein
VGKRTLACSARVKREWARRDRHALVKPPEGDGSRDGNDPVAVRSAREGGSVATPFIVVVLVWLAGIAVTWLVIYSAVLAALSRHDRDRRARGPSVGGQS